MQQNAPFCVLLKKHFRGGGGGGGGGKPLPTAISLSRVGMYVGSNVKLSPVIAAILNLISEQKT